MTSSEKERHWVRIPNKKRDLFPPDEVEFKVMAGKNVETTRIDNQGRLFLGSVVFGTLDLDSPNAVIIIEIGQDGEYVVRKR